MPDILYVVFIQSIFSMLLLPVVQFYRFKQLGRLDNRLPRQDFEQLTGVGQRAVNAQKNSREIFTVLLGAVFIAYAQDVNLNTLSNIGWLFLASRVLYVIAYLADWAVARTTIWLVGFGCCCYIAFVAMMANH